MKLLQRIAVYTLLGGALACHSTSFAQEQEPAAGGEEKVVYTFPRIAESRLISGGEPFDILRNHGSKILIVNYWATWCGPCVEELPYFIRLANEYNVTDVRLVGYSLDFAEEIEEVVDPFLREREVPYVNFVLEVDPNEYIEKVSEEWRGNLPATFFYDADGKLLHQILEPVNYEGLAAALGKAIEKAGLTIEKKAAD